MAMTYEELENSPSISMDRDGGSARRVVKVAWDDIGRAILEIFPGAAFGYPYTASLPGFPWLRAQKMQIDPWDGSHPTGTGQVMNTYPNGAKITVEYAPNKWPDQEFDDGPDQGELKDITFLEQRITFGGEYLTWPNNGVRWADAAPGAGVSGSAGQYAPGQEGDKNFQVFEDINVGVVVPTIEHSMTWNFVRRPPWAGIRACLGKVNSAQHMNCVPETLLFNGCTAERTYSTAGSPTWKLEYRLSEKLYNAPLIAEKALSNFGIFAGGTGYRAGDILFIVGGVGQKAYIRVDTVNAITGAVVLTTVVNSGSYSTIPNPGGGPFSLAGSLTGTGATGVDPWAGRKVSHAQGWNHFMRPNTGRFERMVRKDGTGVYRSTNFRQLYGGRP
jgi:hypothetical protein